MAPAPTNDAADWRLALVTPILAPCGNANRRLVLVTPALAWRVTHPRPAR
ncbi:hypothetical protein [Dactylosporangium sp. NPDC048998]